MKAVILILVIAACVAVYLLAVRKRAPEPTSVDPNELRFSQLDITETFGDDQRYTADQWVPTVPLNASIENPEDRGLPARDASADVIFEVAVKLSALREQFSLPGEGVYCPVCHIANVDHKKLHQPCPKCARKLLSFGWD